jgi:hypothetical protein
MFSCISIPEIPKSPCNPCSRSAEEWPNGSAYDIGLRWMVLLAPSSPNGDKFSTGPYVGCDISQMSRRSMAGSVARETQWERNEVYNSRRATAPQRSRFMALYLFEGCAVLLSGVTAKTRLATHVVRRTAILRAAEWKSLIRG